MSSASRKLIQASGGAAGPADTGDDDFANVVLLLDGDGTSGDDNNTFTDSSTNAHTITENGSVVQGSFSPYGDNWSVYFDGSGDYLSADSLNIGNFGTADFTVEGWFYLTTAPTNYIAVCETRASGATTAGWTVSIDGSGSFYVYSGAYIAQSASGTIESNTLYHWAYTRESGTHRLFLNGSLVASGTTSRTYSDNNFRIGANLAGLEPFTGYESNVRVVKNNALYTSSFTPPTGPLSAVTGTSFLGCQSNRFIDNSSNGHTITVNGTPKVTPFSPFKNDDARDITTDGGSVYFDGGSGDVLVVATDTTLDITGDFTIECWYYNRNTGLYATLFGSSSGSSGSETKIMFDLGTGEINFQYQGGNIGATGGKNSEWNHIAVTRSGSTTRLFLNGNLEAHTNSSYTFTTGQKWVVGNRPPNAPSLNYPFTGFVSDARCIKGTALYISNFTPPTSPLTAITNTSLLLNFQDAGIYDRTGLNNLDTVGNAQIDTAVKKYGTGSMEFDGSGDYLELPSNENLALSTGDFTIEFWAYANSTTNYPYFIDGRSTASANEVVPALYINNGNYEYWVSGAARITGGAFPLNQWVHVALVRNGNTTTLYSNGTSTGSFTDTYNYVSNGLTIGQRKNTSNQSLDGYIDDFRITKGIARYTSNFTAPDAALPKF